MIAQTFTVNTFAAAKVSGSGAYFTKVDLFFATKDSNYPCTVEIRQVDAASGSITSKVVPFSRVTMNASQITTSTDGTKPTPFYFPSPVFLLNYTDYAIVILPGANSPNYRLFVARLGENDLVTGNRVVSQPATGILAVSTRSVQEEDLKFTLYAADFLTSTSGVIVLKNENRDYCTIANISAGFTRTGETIHGETIMTGTFANTKTLSVANNTTFAQGMTSGATGTVMTFSSTQVSVKNVSLAAKFKGGEAIRIRTNNVSTGGIVGNSSGGITAAIYPTGTVIFYDAVTAANTFLHIANVAYSNTGAAPTTGRLFTANSFIRGQVGGATARIVSIDRLTTDTMMPVFDFLQPSNTTVKLTGKFATSNSVRDGSFFDVSINENTDLAAPRYILSRSAESNTTLSSSTMAANRSAELRMEIGSTSRFSSPAVDLRRVSLTTVNNLINSNSAIGSSEDVVKTGGNAKTRYITRKVTLASGQDAEDIRVYLTAYKPSGTQVNVYYKVLHREDSDTFLDATWVPMDLNVVSGTTSTELSDAQNTEDFIEYYYSVPTYSDAYSSGANTDNQSILEYRNSTNRARFVGFKYLAIKIVLTADQTTNPPRVRDLRVIALQK